MILEMDIYGFNHLSTKKKCIYKMTSAEVVGCKQLPSITDKFKYRSKQNGPDQTAPMGAV